MGIIVILVLAAVGYFLYTRYGGNSGKGPFPGEKRPPIDIAKERYAKGEITREEFEKIQDDLT